MNIDEKIYLFIIIFLGLFRFIYDIYVGDLSRDIIIKSYIYLTLEN